MARWFFVTGMLLLRTWRIFSGVLSSALMQHAALETPKPHFSPRMRTLCCSTVPPHPKNEEQLGSWLEAFDKMGSCWMLHILLFGASDRSPCGCFSKLWLPKVGFWSSLKLPPKRVHHFQAPQFWVAREAKQPPILGSPPFFTQPVSCWGSRPHHPWMSPRVPGLSSFRPAWWFHKPRGLSALAAARRGALGRGEGQTSGFRLWFHLSRCHFGTFVGATAVYIYI